MCLILQDNNIAVNGFVSSHGSSVGKPLQLKQMPPSANNMNDVTSNSMLPPQGGVADAFATGKIL